MEEHHVLGVDGGGTRTRCVIASLSGHLLAARVNEYLLWNPGNVTRITGAGRPVVLGAFYMAP